MKELRIISLVPSQTELLVDLGLEENLVGITKFCVHPVSLKKEKKIIGGTKTIHLDKIKALNPTIILCNKEENTKAIVEDCEKICAIHISDIVTLHDAVSLIKEYGVLFNKIDKANEISTRLIYLSDDFKNFIQNKPKLRVAYFIWKTPWMVAANNTFINHLLTLNNFENIFVEKERYPEIDIRTIGKEIDVDLIFLSSEPFPFTEKHIEENFKDHVAKVFIVDGEMFSWYGSRLLKAFDYFKSLHNEIN